jgi:hypothetical protein
MSSVTNSALQGADRYVTYFGTCCEVEKHGIPSIVYTVLV